MKVEPTNGGTEGGSGTRKGRLVLAVVAQLLALLGSPYWALGAVMAPMYADGGVDSDTIFLMIIMVGVPCGMVVASVLMWLTLRAAKWRPLFFVSAIFLILTSLVLVPVLLG